MKIPWFYVPFYKIDAAISHAWYWFRCHTFTKYHLIDIRGMDGYRWGWLDRDAVLLYASFKILQDYVEKEDPQVGLQNLYDKYENTDEWSRKQRESQMADEREIRALYTWWVKMRPANWAKQNLTYDDESVLVQQDEDMLIRLAKVRTRLWT